MRPAHYHLELGQRGRLADAVVGAAQEKLGGRGSPQIVRHHHDRNAGARDLAEKQNLLFEGGVVAVEIQDKQIDISSRRDLDRLRSSVITTIGTRAPATSPRNRTCCSKEE